MSARASLAAPSGGKAGRWQSDREPGVRPGPGGSDYRPGTGRPTRPDSAQTSYCGAPPPWHRNRRAFSGSSEQRSNGCKCLYLWSFSSWPKTSKSLKLASKIHVDSCSEILYHITSHPILCDAIQDVNHYLYRLNEEIDLIF